MNNIGVSLFFRIDKENGIQGGSLARRDVGLEQES